MIKLYILKQYQKDGWMVEDLPSPAEIDRMAKELSKTSDFRDAMETIKKMKKDSDITEDDQKIAEKDLQKVTDSHIEELDKIGAEKEKEIMSV